MISMIYDFKEIARRAHFSDDLKIKPIPRTEPVPTIEEIENFKNRAFTTTKSPTPSMPSGQKTNR